MSDVEIFHLKSITSKPNVISKIVYGLLNLQFFKYNFQIRYFVWYHENNVKSEKNNNKIGIIPNEMIKKHAK